MAAWDAVALGVGPVGPVRTYAFQSPPTSYNCAFGAFGAIGKAVAPVSLYAEQPAERH